MELRQCNSQPRLLELEVEAPARLPRRVEGMGNENSIHFIKYMGSKRNLLGFVAPTVREVTPQGGLVLDLFAGTHAIGYSVKSHARVWGNDIQNYSVPIGKTLLKTDPVVLRKTDVRTVVEVAASKHFARAANMFEEWLAREREAYELAGRDSRRGFDAYSAYIADFDSCMPHRGDPSRLPKRLRSAVLKVERGEPTDPPIMSAVYWANTYFGLEQCLWLDAFRTAIEDVLRGHPTHATALACLLHAATYCSIGTGHFAQYHKVKSRTKLEQQLPYRLRSVGGYWRAKLAEVENNLIPSIGPGKVTAWDFRKVLERLDGVDSIYADPPYSFVHYSRFYHALETLTLYDLPGTEFDGRYRPVPLRHQSPFCIRSKMTNAFEEVLRAGKEMGIPIVWSYSKSGLMPFDDLLALCRTFFPATEVRESRYLHTTMGRADNKTLQVAEVLIICS